MTDKEELYCHERVDWDKIQSIVERKEEIINKRRMMATRGITIPRDNDDSSDETDHFDEPEEWDIPELKFLDSEINNVSVPLEWTTLTPVRDCLNGIGQGDIPTSRDGRYYFIHSIEMNLKFSTQSEDRIATPDDDISFAFALVIDNQTNNTILEPGQVYNNSGINDFLAFRNMKFIDRYHILKHKIDVIRRFQYSDNPGTTNHGIQSKVYHIKRTFEYPIRVVCNGVGFNISDISDISLSFLAASTDPELLLSYISRVRFSG